MCLCASAMASWGERTLDDQWDGTKRGEGFTSCASEIQRPSLTQLDDFQG